MTISHGLFSSIDSQDICPGGSKWYVRKLNLNACLLSSDFFVTPFLYSYTGTAHSGDSVTSKVFFWAFFLLPIQNANFLFVKQENSAFISAIKSCPPSALKTTGIIS